MISAEQARYERALKDWMIATINVANNAPHMRDKSEEVWDEELDAPLKHELDETVLLAGEHMRENDASVMGSMFRILGLRLQEAGRQLERRDEE